MKESIGYQLQAKPRPPQSRGGGVSWVGEAGLETREPGLESCPLGSVLRAGIYWVLALGPHSSLSSACPADSPQS